MVILISVSLPCTEKPWRDRAVQGIGVPRRCCFEAGSLKPLYRKSYGGLSHLAEPVPQLRQRLVFSVS